MTTRASVGHTADAMWLTASSRKSRSQIVAIAAESESRVDAFRSTPAALGPAFGRKSSEAGERRSETNGAVWITPAPPINGPCNRDSLSCRFIPDRENNSLSGGDLIGRFGDKECR